MSSERAERHGRRLILCGLLIALAWVLAPTRSTAKARNAATAEAGRSVPGVPWHGGDEVRQGQKIFTSIPRNMRPARMRFWVAPDCHTTIKDFPHPAKIAKVQCATCHADEVKAYAGSVHAFLGETACATCHGSVHELTAAAANLARQMRGVPCRRSERICRRASTGRRRRRAIPMHLSANPATDPFMT